MLSFWEKQSFQNYDIIIIGAGITGISSALSIKEKSPEKSIVILEKNILPTGASTKNAGFACVGSLSEIVSDLETMTELEVQDLVKMRKEGLDILRKRLGDNAIDYKEYGSYELLTEKDQHLVAEIDRINAILNPIFKRPIFKEVENTFDFSNEIKKVISNSAEGQIDTGKIMKSLIAKALSLGIEIKNGYDVLAYNETQDGIEIAHDELPLFSEKLIVCTNAFSQKLFPKETINPGRGQVLITKPIKDLKFKGIFHFNEGYYYFRNFEDRIIFGGGRNLDFDGETTSEFELNNKIQDHLESILKNIILPNTGFEIDHKWCGIMAFGDTKTPIIEQKSKHVFVAIRFGGMGVAIGSKAGELISDLII